MVFFKKKENKWKQFFTGQFFVSGLGLLLVIFISIPLARSISTKYRINKEVENLQQEIDAMQKKNLELEKLVKYLDSDKFVEEKARLSLGLKKPGEEAVLINGADPKKFTMPEQNQANSEDKDASQIGGFSNNPKNWWDYFLKK